FIVVWAWTRKLLDGLAGDKPEKPKLAAAVKPSARKPAARPSQRSRQTAAKLPAKPTRAPKILPALSLQPAVQPPPINRHLGQPTAPGPPPPLVRTVAKKPLANRQEMVVVKQDIAPPEPELPTAVAALWAVAAQVSTAMRTGKKLPNLDSYTKQQC